MPANLTPEYERAERRYREATRDDEKQAELLAMIRVFAKRPGHPPDLAKPFTLPCGSTVEDLARRIHRELPEQMKHARIGGSGHRDGQHVHRSEALRDRDIVEIHE